MNRLKTWAGAVAGVVLAVAGSLVGVQAASEYFIPYFGPAANCIHDASPCGAPNPNGYLHIVNRSATSTAVIIKGRDSTGADRGSRTESAIPAHGSRKVWDHKLEGTGGLSDGEGAWSLTVTSTGDVSVVPFRAVTTGGSLAFVPLPVERKAGAMPSLRVYSSVITCARYSNRTSNVGIESDSHYRHGRHWLLFAKVTNDAAVAVPVTEANWPQAHLFGAAFDNFHTLHAGTVVRIGYEFEPGAVVSPVARPFAVRWLDTHTGTMGPILNVNLCPNGITG